MRAVLLSIHSEGGTLWKLYQTLASLKGIGYLGLTLTFVLFPENTSKFMLQILLWKKVAQKTRLPLFSFQIWAKSFLPVSLVCLYFKIDFISFIVFSVAFSEMVGSNCLDHISCILSHGQLFVTPWTAAHQAPLSMEYWGGLPFLLQRSSYPETEPMSPVSSVLWADSLPLGSPGHLY